MENKKRIENCSSLKHILIRSLCSFFVIVFCILFTSSFVWGTQTNQEHFSIRITLDPYETWVNEENKPMYSNSLINGRYLQSEDFFRDNFPVQINEDYGSNNMTFTISYKDVNIVYSIISPYVKVNGVETEIDCVPSFDHKGSWLIPCRFTFETLGGKVGWNAEAREIVVEIDL